MKLIGLCNCSGALEIPARSLNLMWLIKQEKVFLFHTKSHSKLNWAFYLLSFHVFHNFQSPKKGYIFFICYRLITSQCHTLIPLRSSSTSYTPESFDKLAKRALCKWLLYEINQCVCFSELLSAVIHEIRYQTRIWRVKMDTTSIRSRLSVCSIFVRDSFDRIADIMLWAFEIRNSSDAIKRGKKFI